MPKLKIKRGCCYDPAEDDSSDTCQVFTNPHFDSRVSEALCAAGKSSPDFPNNQRKQISWGYLDYDLVKPYPSKNHPDSSRTSNEIAQHLMEYHNMQKHESHTEKHEENDSLFTIYGNKQHEAFDSDRNISDSPFSDDSVYRPTTRKKENKQINSSEKCLDCISMCLWKCSSWCQKID